MSKSLGKQLWVRIRHDVLSVQTKSRILRRKIYSTLGMRYWFPHFPLAIAMVLSGAVQLAASFGALRKILALPPRDFQELSQLTSGYKTLAIHGVPMEVVGALLVLMGVALLFRSRMALVFSLIITLGAIALEVWPLSGHHNWHQIYFNGLILIALLLSRRAFTRTSLATGTLFALTAIILTVGYGVLGSYTLGDQFHPPIKDFLTALYFSVTTLSTVGYGDIVPSTIESRIFAVTLMILGLVMFATALTAIVGPLINDRLMHLIQPPPRKHSRRNHVIVAGDGPFARNTVYSLLKATVPTTWILARKSDEDDYPDLDYVIGDAADLDVLREANIGKAKAILALTEDDSDNAFIILAAKDGNASIRTVVAANDSHHIRRMRAVHADVVIALPVLGAELVAMALAGQEIQIDAFINQLQKLENI